MTWASKLCSAIHSYQIHKEEFWKNKNDASSFFDYSTLKTLNGACSNVNALKKLFMLLHFPLRQSEGSPFLYYIRRPFPTKFCRIGYVVEWTTQKWKTSLLVAGMVLVVSSSKEINLIQHKRIERKYYNKQLTWGIACLY